MDSVLCVSHQGRETERCPWCKAEEFQLRNTELRREISKIRDRPAPPDPPPLYLRDYFAAAALTGLLSYYGGASDDEEMAYRYADRMLEERGK